MCNWVRTYLNGQVWIGLLAPILARLDTVDPGEAAKLEQRPGGRHRSREQGGAREEEDEGGEARQSFYMLTSENAAQQQWQPMLAALYIELQHGCPY